MPFQIERKQNLSLFLCLYLSLVLKEAQGHLRDMSFTSFFDPGFLRGHKWKLAGLAECYFRCAQYEKCSPVSKKNPKYFYRRTCLCLHYWIIFIHVVILTHSFPGMPEPTFSEKGEKKKEDVWAPPGDLLYSGWLKGIARKHVYTSIRQKNYLDYFLLKDPFLCLWAECFRSRTPGFVLGFRMPPCQCRPGFII